MTSQEKRSKAMKASWERRKADGWTKKRKKGKWSKMARAKHSVRMKERFAAKQSNPKSVVAINRVSVQERLNIIEHNVNAIRQQLGG